MVSADAAAAVIDRSGCQCEAAYPVKVGECWFIRRCLHRAEQMHHKKFRSRLGSGKNAENLAHLCVSCHNRAGDNADAWFARWRTRSHQREGATELLLWNFVSNLVRSMDGLAAVVDRLLIVGKPVLFTVCGECGLVDMMSGMPSPGPAPAGECRKCVHTVIWKDVTDEARTYKNEMRI